MTDLVVELDEIRTETRGTVVAAARRARCSEALGRGRCGPSVWRRVARRVVVPGDADSRRSRRRRSASSRHLRRRALPERVARRQPGGLFVERRQRGQLRHLHQGTRRRHATSADDPSRRGHAFRRGLRTAAVSRSCVERAARRAIYLTPPVPGSERKLADFHSTTTHIGRMSVSWTPDGNWLAIGLEGADGSSISLVPVAGGGQPRRVMANPVSDGAYFFPAVSPSGKRLAYAVCTGVTPAMSTASSSTRTSSPRAHLVDSPTTRRCSRDCVGSRRAVGGVWRALRRWSSPVARGACRRRTGASGIGGGRGVSGDLARRQPAGVHPRRRRRRPVEVRGRAGPVSVLSSTTSDFDPQLSPDGPTRAFVTSRSGRGPEIWVATLDGTSAIALTHRTGRGQGSPRWSPDGRWLAFDAQA